MTNLEESRDRHGHDDPVAWRVLIHVNAERFGGTETHVFYLCRALRAHGVDVTVTGLRTLEMSQEWRHELQELGVHIVFPPLPSMLLPLKLVPLVALLRLLFLLPLRRYDCLVGQGLGAAFLRLRLFLKTDGFLVWHEHGAGGRPTEEGYEDRLGRDTVRRFAPRLQRMLTAVDGIIVGSEVARDNLVNIQGATRPIRIIPPLDGVQLDGMGGVASPDPGGTLKVVHLGRIAERKGIQELLKVWKELQIGEAELHLYGPISPWASELLPEWRRIPGVHFHGPLSRDGIPSMAASASFAVIPSMCEGFGLAAYEFMALGLPFVMTDTGAAREFGRDNPDCVICERSMPSLREAMLRMAQLVRSGAVSRERLRGFWLDHYSPACIASEHVAALMLKETWAEPALRITGN